MKYPFYFQLDAADCGPTCLKMIAEYYGKTYSLDYLREYCFITREGVSLQGISQAAEKIGFKTLPGKLRLDELRAGTLLPAVLHWNQEHFVVLYRVTASKFIIGDPVHGIMAIDASTFCSLWQSHGSDEGVALFLLPSDRFYTNMHGLNNSPGIAFLFRYLIPFKRQLWSIALYMALTTALGMSFPYFTKTLVDKGIGLRNQSLILLISVSQLVVFVSSTILDIFKSWLLLKVNAKISLQIVSDFLTKLLRLPVRYFDSKSVGDISQRINDHHRIESFLTGDAISSVFSILQIFAFSIILLTYSFNIWCIFASLSFIAIIWIFFFQKKREHLDYIRFSQNRVIQEKLYEFVVGMQDIKLNNSETSKRLEWEEQQRKIYSLNIKSLQLQHYRQTGFTFLTQLKNIIISYLAAVAIIENKMSLGIMLGISFIIGQTNGPLQQLVESLRAAQDARLSLDRLQEVHIKENEDKTRHLVPSTFGEIRLKHLSFQYQGPLSPFVLKDVDLTIPKGKVTAIVGASGSGKTTLMKILLGFYNPTKGEVLLGDMDIFSLLPSWWRSQCGAVMQDGFIFSDSIIKNICLDQDVFDQRLLDKAMRISNTEEFVKQLPLGYNTRIGSNGLGLSGGQKQRILIARAIYRDPAYLFFDEATSSLDANNEKGIMNNLADFFKNRTVVIIAHRLSTVKNADKIIMLEKGQIIESGTHQQLSLRKGRYFSLVKDQLELGT